MQFYLPDSTVLFLKCVLTNKIFVSWSSSLTAIYHRLLFTPTRFRSSHPSHIFLISSTRFPCDLPSILLHSFWYHSDTSFFVHSYSHVARPLLFFHSLHMLQFMCTFRLFMILSLYIIQSVNIKKKKQIDNGTSLFMNKLLGISLKYS